MSIEDGLEVCPMVPFLHDTNSASFAASLAIHNFVIHRQ